MLFPISVIIWNWAKDDGFDAWWYHNWRNVKQALSGTSSMVLVILGVLSAYEQLDLARQDVRDSLADARDWAHQAVAGLFTLGDTLGTLMTIWLVMVARINYENEQKACKVANAWKKLLTLFLIVSYFLGHYDFYNVTEVVTLQSNKRYLIAYSVKNLALLIVLAFMTVQVVSIWLKYPSIIVRHKQFLQISYFYFFAIFFIGFRGMKRLESNPSHLFYYYTLPTLYLVKLMFIYRVQGSAVIELENITALDKAGRKSESSLENNHDISQLDRVAFELNQEQIELNKMRDGV